MTIRISERVIYLKKIKLISILMKNNKNKSSFVKSSLFDNLTLKKKEEVFPKRKNSYSFILDSYTFTILNLGILLS